MKSLLEVIDFNNKTAVITDVVQAIRTCAAVFKTQKSIAPTTTTSCP